MPIARLRSPMAAPLAIAAFIVLAIVTTSGCEPRMPVERGEAVGAADDLLRYRGLAWGDPVDVLTPGPADARGHRWWQVRYDRPPGADLSADPTAPGPRIILVDAVSGWSQFPPPGYTLREPLSAVPPDAPPTPPPAIAEGEWVVLVTAPVAMDAETAALSQRECSRLNALAASTSLYPLFSLHQDPGHRWAIVYGWQGDRGIAKDEKVREWLHLRTSYGDGTWSNLLEQ